MLANMIPVFVMLVPLFLLVSFMELWRKHSRHFKGRSPLTRDLLRSPGESLRIQIENLNWDISAYLALVPAIPLVIFSAYLLATKERPAIGIGSAIFDAFVVAACLIYVLWKLMSLIKQKRKLGIGLEAELAVAQELNELMYEGHKVFHDFPAEEFNIDHVVVGETGVYAVETKGRTKPVAKNDEATWEVTYDGNSLRFPGWQENKPLEQAKSQAVWLRKWLFEAVGENIPVKPVLVLPGWFINRTGKGGIWVCNGKNMQTLLRHPDHPPLSAKIVQQIAYQLDQRCRNVKRI